MTVANRAVSAAAGLPSRDRVVWAVAVLAFVVGDATTTWVGLGIGLAEAHPVSNAAVSVLGFVPALLVSKFVVLGWAVLGYCYARSRGFDSTALAMPGVLALLGSVIVLHNLRLILVVL